MISRVRVGSERVYEREPEEESGRQDDQDRRSYIDRAITRVLQPSTPAKGRVAGEVLVVSAQLPLDSLFCSLSACQPGR
jgi:hypothetical protein